MNKCDECFGASNGDCDDCPFRTINAYTSKINEVNEAYLINVEERAEKINDNIDESIKQYLAECYHASMNIKEDKNE